MTKTIWTIIRSNNRLLLVQQSEFHHNEYSWTLPECKFFEPNSIPELAAKQGLKNIGVSGTSFKQLCRILTNNYENIVLCCNRWSGEPYTSTNNIAGIGWFTLPEMYALGQSLAPHINSSIMYIAYLMQHYDQYPGEWAGHWNNI